MSYAPTPIEVSAPDVPALRLFEPAPLDPFSGLPTLPDIFRDVVRPSLLEKGVAAQTIADLGRAAQRWHDYWIQLPEWRPPSSKWSRQTTSGDRTVDPVVAGSSPVGLAFSLSGSSSIRHTCLAAHVFCGGIAFAVCLSPRRPDYVPLSRHRPTSHVRNPR